MALCRIEMTPIGMTVVQLQNLLLPHVWAPLQWACTHCGIMTVLLCRLAPESLCMPRSGRWPLMPHLQVRDVVRPDASILDWCQVLSFMTNEPLHTVPPLTLRSFEDWPLPGYTILSVANVGELTPDVEV